ncbi:hypothetical protein [Erythrobacter sp. QSSC1-22B]|uniref:hypothetical protein n=1 Tax=Erythrobacter sp. QSSC1-22B TaxID=1860125 RepID=UPI0011A908DF|nr:hypothetical protein [Erythrobacter sp. QSSC1-22B]
MDSGPKYLGSGITRERVYNYDDPDAAEAVERLTIEGLCAQIERECFAIMSANDLPDRHCSYFCDESGNWSFERPPPPYGIFGIPRGWSVCNDVSTVVKRRGYEYDSTVGFAAGMLCDLIWLRRHMQDGNTTEVALHGFHLGNKWAKRNLKQNWEADALRGRKWSESAVSTRKADDADRLALIEEIKTERGKGNRDAFRIAAMRRPEWGSESTFRNAFYKKASKPSD